MWLTVLCRLWPRGGVALLLHYKYFTWTVYCRIAKRFLYKMFVVYRPLNCNAFHGACMVGAERRVSRNRQGGGGGGGGVGGLKKWIFIGFFHLSFLCLYVVSLCRRVRHEGWIFDGRKDMWVWLCHSLSIWGLVENSISIPPESSWGVVLKNCKWKVRKCVFQMRRGAWAENLNDHLRVCHSQQWSIFRNLYHYHWIDWRFGDSRF